MISTPKSAGRIIRTSTRPVLEALETRRLLALTHLYTFNNGTANDTAGTAHATLFNGAKITDGWLWLQNQGKTSGDATLQYAEIPANVLPATGSVSIEFWYTNSSTISASAHLFDFGDQVGTSGNSYLFYTPKSSGNDARSALRPAGGSERIATATGGTFDGYAHMAVVVIDSSTNLLKLYVDGALTSSVTLSGATMASVNNLKSFLGKSLFDIDPGFTGAIDELRIYNHALSTVEVTQHHGEGATRPPQTTPARQIEKLNRGLVAINKGSGNVYLSWRQLATDPINVSFNIYRSTNGGTATKLNSNPITKTTDYNNSGVSTTVSNAYYVRPIINGVEQAASETFVLPAGAPAQPYLRVPLQIPPGGQMPGINGAAGHDYTYSANDTSVGDVDGDGEYELIVLWGPSDSKDNSQAGYTGEVYIDAYKLNGTRLWRINLGKNIRAGAHYTQFMVYDFDGDGKAEVAAKTAPGTVDGLGNNVILGSDSPTADYRNSEGYILSGPEYLTMFNGLTGANMATVPYVVGRGNVGAWGDTYGNRVDRFLAGVAYLDGQRPSLIMARGYYTRAAIAAWDWRNGQLTQRWLFDTGNSTTGPLSAYRGQGTHSLSVADVDGDGKDEIIYGAATINDNGTAMSTSQLGHGDALHASDMNPIRPGIEVYQVHEGTGSNGHVGASLRDGATSQLLVSLPVTQYTDSEGVLRWPDVGRGLAIDVDPRSLGYESWNSYHPNLYGATGNIVAANAKPTTTNFGVWWDADPLRELLNGTTLDKWNPNNNGTGRVLTIYQVAPISSNNGTKATPNLSGDLFGDWREEIIMRATDNTALYIFTTTATATTRMTTLMHDTQYRVAIAWQNTAYNQPPHTSYYMGDSMPSVPRSMFYLAGVVNAPTNLTATPLSSSQVRLNWQDANTQETGFQIERATDGINFVNIGSVAPNVLTFLDTGRRGSTTYQYRIRATGLNAPSEYSNVAQAFTLAATGTISGVVFDDANANGIREGSEAALSGRVVYIDMNNNAVFDAGDSSATTDGAGAYNLTGQSVGTYTVRQQISAGWVQTTPAAGAARSVTLGEAQSITGQDFGTRQPPPAQGNLSVRKAVTASSQQSSSYEPAKVADGNSSTRWASAPSDNEWIKIDLGQGSNITGINLNWYSFFGIGYSIDVSTDDQAWTTVYSTTTGDGGIDSITNLASSGRYVRMLGTQRSNPNAGYSLWDFIVYGSVSETPPVTGSITGHLFWDSNADGVRNSSEVGQAAKLVFLDTNGDGVLQSTEQSVLTDSNGAYTFTGLAAGNYAVRRVVPYGYRVTTPNANVTLAAGATVSGVLIGTTFA